MDVKDPAVPVQTPGRRHYNFLFMAKLDTPALEEVRSQSPEITSVGWFDPASLPSLSEHTHCFLAALGVVEA